MNNSEEIWLDASFIRCTPLWFVFERSAYENGDRFNAMVPWKAEPLAGGFQPACRDEETALQLIENRKHTLDLVPRELNGKELQNLLGAMAIGKQINVFVYLGINNVRCFQTIHLLEEFER
jgi:hypothetical protein